MKKHLFFWITLCVMCASCHRAPVQQFEGMAFGTLYHITYVGERSEDLPAQVDSLLKTLNATFSIFDTNSLISKVNRNEQVTLDQEFLDVLNLSLLVNQETNGAFECTIQPLVELWGFGRENQKQVVPQAQIDSVKEYVGSKFVHIENNTVKKNDPRVQLNFNAIAKGFAVDKVARFLTNNGYTNCLVEIGGEIVARGNKNGRPWRVGIQVPTETADGAAASEKAFDLNDKAVATSGNYRNYFEQDGHRYTHILNPVTGKPEESNLLSVTVIAPDCATADAYATAFMVLGVEASMKILEKHPELEATFIYDDNGAMKIR